MRIAYRSHATTLLTAAVDQRRRLADRRAVRAELLAVVSTGNAILTEARAERAVLRVAKTGTRRANARLVARLEGRERNIRLECREISRGAPWLIRGLIGRQLRRRRDRWLHRRHLDGARRLLQKRHELSHLRVATDKYDHNRGILFHRAHVEKI